MKRSTLILLIVLIGSACKVSDIDVSNENKEPLVGEVLITGVPQNTATEEVTPIATYIPTYTPVSTPVCDDQTVLENDDHGIPEKTNRIDGPGWDFAQFDELDFYVYQANLHNRLVTVAIEKDYWGIDEKERTIFSEYIFHTWNLFWDEFGGFPFARYSLVIGDDLPYDADKYHYGEFGTGWETSLTDDWENYMWGHGIYHAWVGNGFRQYDDARWLMEGFTEYYGVRQSPPDYIQQMQIHYSLYMDIVNSGKEIPLSDIKEIHPGDMYTLEHYWKGALVAYMLDLELKATGNHIGEVARELYQRFGVYSQGYPTNDEILNIINEISGSDYSQFFDDYIYGLKPLPIDPSTFVWVCHDSNVYTKPIPKNTPTPSFTYIIDGDRSDWNEKISVLDDIGDSIRDDVDIIGYSFDDDNYFLDILIETRLPITKNKVTFDIRINLIDENGKNAHFSLNVNSDGTVSGGNYPEEWNNLPGVLVAWDSVVEIQLPKHYLDNYPVRNIEYISLFTDYNGNWTYVDIVD